VVRELPDLKGQAVKFDDIAELKSLRFQLEIKFPFKRNGLPCCEDEPGSAKIALK